jgi:hypothetical protein
MAPSIGTGDMVVFKRLHGVPRVGDVVAVTVPDEARTRYGYPAEVVHRVVRVSPSGALTTKGDAKAHPDPFSVPASSIKTKVVFTVPAAGRVVAFLMSPLGLLWLAGGAAMLFALPLIERRQESEQAEQQTLAAVHAELHAISEKLELLQAEPVQAPPPAAEEEPMPFVAAPTVDWLDLETTPEDDLMPHWPEPPEFFPGYDFIGRDRAPKPAAKAAVAVAPEPAPATYVVRRRSGGLLAALR